VPVLGHPRIAGRAAAPRPSWPSAPGDALSPLGISRGELNRMSAALSGTIVLPGSPSYDTDRQGNPLFPASPKIIVMCAAFNDVRLALGWAHEHGWPVTLRSGGHSTAGFSLGEGMILDVSGIDGIAIDTAAMTARIGAGARFGAINSTLDMYGLHVPGGGCPTVGVAGYMQGGGYGFTSREFGMNCDNVLEVTVMLADGSLVVASDSENKELYWAIRGGTGGNFGVLLEIVYRLVPLREMWGFALQWPMDQGAEALAALQRDFMGSAGDTKVGYQLALTTKDAGPVVVMMGMYHGTRDAGLRAIADLRAVGSPSLIIDRESTYAELNEGLIAALPGVPEAPGQATYELKRCGYIANTLTLCDWQTILDYYRTTPNPWNIVGIEPYGGAIAKPTSKNAFIHRDVSMDFFIDSFFSPDWDDNGGDVAQAWIDGYMDAMGPYFTGRVYQNYPWRGLPDYEGAYWGNAIGKLRDVKVATDPDDFFHFEQSIPPATNRGKAISISRRS
jgi:hypothetical protein